MLQVEQGSGSDGNNAVRMVKTFRPDSPLVRDHVINEVVVVPAAVQLELVCSTIGSTLERSVCRFDKLRFVRPVVVDYESVETNVSLKRLAEDKIRFFIVGSDDSIFSLGECELGVLKVEKYQVPLDEYMLHWEFKMEKNHIESYFEERGNRYGETFQGLETVWADNNRALGKIVLNPDNLSRYCHCEIHPTIFDASLHSVIGTICSKQLHRDNETLVPYAFGRVKLYRQVKTGTHYFALACFVDDLKKSQLLVFDIEVIDFAGSKLFTIEGFTLKRIKMKLS